MVTRQEDTHKEKEKIRRIIKDPSKEMKNK